MRGEAILRLAGWLVWTPWVVAQDPALQREVAELRQRLDDLEDQQAKVAERLGSRALLQGFSAREIDLGGHVSSLFTHMDGDGGDTTGHVVSLFELFVKAKLDDQWSLFATPGVYLFHGGLVDDPSTTGTPSDPTLTRGDSTELKAFAARLQAEWRLRDALEVRGGLIGTPHGTTNREYFIPARQIAQGSLHTRHFLWNQLYPQQVLGLLAGGKLELGGGSGDRLEYEAYFGVEPGVADDGLGGARLAYGCSDLGLTFALDYGRGTRDATATPDTNFGILQAPFPNQFFVSRDYEFVGCDLDWRWGPLIHKSELYSCREDGFDDQLAVSLETSWFVIPELALSYRFDYYDAGSDVAPWFGTETPLGHATEHVVGLCYSPNSNVRLRLDAHRQRVPLSDDSLEFLNLSWSLSF